MIRTQYDPRAQEYLTRDNFADLLHLYDLGLLLEADPEWAFIERCAAQDGWTSLLRFALSFAPATPSAEPHPSTPPSPFPPQP